LLVIGIFSVSQNSIYGQKLKEYESELLGIKLQHPEEWEENMQEEKSTFSDNNHRSISFNLNAENAVTIYVHDTDPEIKSFNHFITDILNGVTLGGHGPVAIHFIETDLNYTLADLPAIKLVYDRNLMLGDNSIDTLMELQALSEDGSQTYGVTYRTEKPYFEEYLPTVKKIIDSIEITN
jgi:hypothetical protein